MLFVFYTKEHCRTRVRRIYSTKQCNFLTNLLVIIRQRKTAFGVINFQERQYFSLFVA